MMIARAQDRDEERRVRAVVGSVDIPDVYKVRDVLP
jgi:hypothetical protein